MGNFCTNIENIAGREPYSVLSGKVVVEKVKVLHRDWKIGDLNPT